MEPWDIVAPEFLAGFLHIGLLDDDRLREAVEARGRGEALRRVLARRLGEKFACFLLSQAQSEADVKVVKELVRQ